MLAYDYPRNHYMFLKAARQYIFDGTETYLCHALQRVANDCVQLHCAQVNGKAEFDGCSLNWVLIMYADLHHWVARALNAKADGSRNEVRTFDQAYEMWYGEAPDWVRGARLEWIDRSLTFGNDAGHVPNILPSSQISDFIGDKSEA